MTKELSIIVIDDDGNYPRIMKEALTAAQIPGELIWLDDGEKALLALEERVKNKDLGNCSPFVVLLDINMPRMNGFEVLRQIRSKESLQTLPVLMLSVSQSPDDIQHAYRFGANAYLTKPSDFKRMQEMLHAIHQFWFQHAKLHL